MAVVQAETADKRRLTASRRLLRQGYTEAPIYRIVELLEIVGMKETSVALR